MNKVKDFSAIIGLVELEFLDLRRNTPHSINYYSYEFDHMTDLEYLEWKRSHISDISFLSELVNLRTLYLCENYISDLTHLNGLSNLNTLWLEDNPICLKKIVEFNKILPKCKISHYFSVTCSINICNCFSSVRGHILGTEKITIKDAVEILCYLAELNSVIVEGNASWYAACIMGGDSPKIEDAVEILCYLAELPSMLK